MASEFAHSMRQLELELALPLLPKGGRLLELGAGDGWQARRMHDQGFLVSAVDVQTSTTGAIQYFPVNLYDGVKLPFADRSFDAIYSSSVLEHVIEFDQVQRELARVLRPGGVAVHCVPSAIWRFWTTVGHPLHVLQIARRMLSKHQNTIGSPSSLHKHRVALSRMKPLMLLRLALVSPRHGEHGSLVSEHWLFSQHRWQKRFKATGWQIESTFPCRIFYTGNELMGGRLANTIRRRLATVLGSSTLIFVLKPPHTTDSEK